MSSRTFNLLWFNFSWIEAISVIGFLLLSWINPALGQPYGGTPRSNINQLPKPANQPTAPVPAVIQPQPAKFCTLPSDCKPEEICRPNLTGMRVCMGQIMPPSTVTLEPPPCSPTGKDYRADMDKINARLATIDAELKKNLPGLGSGWCGNVTGSGPKCNVVSDAFWKIWNKQPKLQLKCLAVNFAFDPGILPCDLAAHISVGIYLIGAPSGSTPIFEIDPWRNATCTPGPVTGSPTNSTK